MLKIKIDRKFTFLIFLRKNISLVRTCTYITLAVALYRWKRIYIGKEK